MSRHRSMALIACAVVTFIGARPALAETSPRLESCTQWDYQNGQFGFLNNCGEPVAVLLHSFPISGPSQRKSSRATVSTPGLPNKN
jgi:predicted ferric reductase